MVFSESVQDHSLSPGGGNSGGEAVLFPFKSVQNTKKVKKEIYAFPVLDVVVVVPV